MAKADGVTTVIPAHGFLIVWCDKLTPLSQLHASFKLAAEGGVVVLTAADESWSNRMAYTAMKGDESVGRYPDGSSNVITMNVPTIRKANITGSYANGVTQLEEDGLHDLAASSMVGLSVRYVADRLVLSTTTPAKVARMDICNLAGQKLWEQDIDLSSGQTELMLTTLPNGCYLARLADGNGHSATCKFIKK